ncbi:hypothetical protein SDC9_57093 [bioreactor metagenome]|uniref:Uncharacterized protein n=1 Tax=bioreactor metagenome TaxID=1076179 RepID=A0A644X3Z6_9ZZZZ
MGIFHQFDDLRKGCVFPDFFGPVLDGSVFVDAAADDGIPSFFLHRHALSCKHRFIDGCQAFRDCPIDSHLLAGTDNQNVPNHDGVQFDFLLIAVTDDAGCLRRQAHQFFDGLRRLAF